MDIKKYTCNICNKNYKTYKSMWHHKKHIHDSKKNNDPEMTHDETQNDPYMTQNDDNIDNKEENETDTKLTNNTICMYCNKKFSVYTHMRRHLKICKSKNNIIKENEELKQEMSEMKKSLDELKKIMLDMMNKKCKMHPKTLQKMINSNNIINNNITINNNIQYVELGDEELHKVFSKKEKMKILCGTGSVMDKIIKHTHLNDDYPQFQTIIITNVKGNQAYIYNKDLKKFIVMDKTEILIGYRFDDLIEFYNECKDKIEPEKRESIEKLFLLKHNDTYYTNKSKEYNVIIYNECNKDNIKYKPLDENILYSENNELNC